MPPITAIALEQMLTFLVPIFLEAANQDVDAARHTARQTLAEYAAESEQELRLAALIIAFRHRALDALRRSADPDLDSTTVMRLNASASTMNSAALRCRRELVQIRTQKADPETQTPQAVPLSLPGSLTRLVQSVLAPDPDADAAPVAKPVRLSRQQRRLAEREAAKAHRRSQAALPHERTPIAAQRPGDMAADTVEHIAGDIAAHPAGHPTAGFNVQPGLTPASA